MIVLYDLALSPYAQKVKIALREKGIAFELRVPDIFAGDRDLAAVSPRQEVPVLVDGETAIFDSTIILDYLEERWPETPLMPDDPAARARMRMIEEVCDTQFEAVNWGITEIALFKRAEGERAAAMLKAAGQQTGRILEWLSRELGAREYFGGETFGRADLAVLPHLNNAAAMRNGPAAGSTLDQWRKRVNERPSVAATVAEIKAALGGFREVPHRIASGAAKRQYRDHRLEWMLKSGGVDVVLEGLRAGNIRFAELPG